MERTKFYSKDDLGNGIQLLRVQKVMDDYNPDAELKDINDVLELYNVKLFLDNGLALRTWTEDLIELYCATAKGFNQLISLFIKDNISSACFESIEYQYQQDFWDVIEQYGHIASLTDDVLEEILVKFPEQIENILQCKQIVKEKDRPLSNFLLKSPLSAPILINTYYVTDNGYHEKHLYIPKGLEANQKLSIINNYLDGQNVTLGIVRIIMQSKDVDGLRLDTKTRLKAKKLEPELAKIPNGAIVSKVQTGFSIEFINDASKPLKQESLEGLVLHYVYNEHYLNQLSETELFNVFWNHFGYLDSNGLLTLWNNRNEDSLFEKIETREVKGLYRMNDIFRMKNNIAVSQLAMFDSYLRRRGKTLERLIKHYYEEHFRIDYGFPSLALNMPNEDDSYVNKNKVIAPEMESVVNQFNLFVEEGNIDPELFEESYPLPITLGKSLLYGKHKYVVIEDGQNGIYYPLYCLFSDQSLLSYVHPYKEQHYHTLFDLLQKVGTLQYSNYEDHQRVHVDYLINNGYLVNNQGVLSFGNIERITALKLLYDRREISYYHCEAEVRKEIDKMVADGWLKYDEYLFSPEERHYISLFLNSSEYSNGMQLRNKYSHGRKSCLQSEDEHKNAYYYFLMIFVIILLKIDEDMRMSIYLNENINNA